MQIWKILKEGVSNFYLYDLSYNKIFAEVTEFLWQDQKGAGMQPDETF